MIKLQVSKTPKNNRDKWKNTYGKVNISRIKRKNYWWSKSKGRLI